MTTPQSTMDFAFPRAYPTRARNREHAAAYVGVGATKFDELVRDGRMPKPFVIDGRVLWCVYELDKYFDCLPRRGDGSVEHPIHDEWLDQRT
jgi:hypothetical protein